MADKLPLLISVPHGGTTIPEELSDRHSLSPGDILDDIDPFTLSVYDFGSAVEEQLAADIARPFIDLNRSADQLPPAFPDGVIKSETCQKVPVYRPGSEPDPVLIRNLLARYHEPYHAELSRLLRQDSILMMIDCHSMSEYPPPIAADRSVRRPLVNLGDLDGHSCPAEITVLLAEAFVKCFEITRTDVLINLPFKGGYITRNHGNGAKPVIQVELNRVLYLDPAHPRRMDSARVSDVCARMKSTLRLFHQIWRGEG
ncbi:MAG: N-formylglutamate amidohydrolase [Ignavibacteria bacterium]|nr:N-formylglutamate amidohydrolase [Ignavibacteria bacterium]